MLSALNTAERGRAPTTTLCLMVCSGTWMKCSMLVDSLVTTTHLPSGEAATPSGSMPTLMVSTSSPLFGLITEALASSSLEM